MQIYYTRGVGSGEAEGAAAPLKYLLKCNVKEAKGEKSTHKAQAMFALWSFTSIVRLTVYTLAPPTLHSQLTNAYVTTRY